VGLVEYADRYHAADDQLPVKNHADPKQCVGPDNPNDIITMAAFGVLGCVMNKFGFPQAPMALAFVLWNRPQAIADQSQSSFLIFWQTPVAGTLMTFLVLVTVISISRFLFSVSRKSLSK
jgi:TctA family transporter